MNKAWVIEVVKPKSYSNLDAEQGMYDMLVRMSRVGMNVNCGSPLIAFLSFDIKYDWHKKQGTTRCLGSVFQKEKCLVTFFTKI